MIKILISLFLFSLSILTEVDCCIFTPKENISKPLRVIDCSVATQLTDSCDYRKYHQQILKAEEYIANAEYAAALLVYENLFEDYEFVFQRSFKVATQLAFLTGDKQKGIQYLYKGMAAGWTPKSIKKNKFIRGNLSKADWKSIKKDYPKYRAQYESSLDQTLRTQVKKMSKKDQWKAFQAFLKFTDKGQDSYAERKFAPHSEQQMKALHAILKNYGYPGEQLIGDNVMMSTIISHHNSISQEYVRRDTIYASIKPKLLDALRKGEISPFEMALIDEWYHTVKEESVYGIINPPTAATLGNTNKYRAEIYMRSVELRNQLVEVEKKTGMNLYLLGAPWLRGKINVLP